MKCWCTYLFLALIASRMTVLSTTALAHIPPSVNQSNIVDGFGGYGYLSAPQRSESEAQASTATEFNCDSSSQRERISTHCGGAEIRPEVATENLLRETMKLQAISRFQEQTMEYLSLRVASVSKQIPLKITRPACISQDSPTWRMIQANLLSPTHGARNWNFRSRLDAVKESVDPKNVAHGLLWMMRLKMASEAFHCNDSTHTKHNSANCSSINYQQKRLANQYPVLWSSWGLEAPRFSAIESQVYKMIGMSTMKNKNRNFPNLSTDLKDQRELGKMIERSYGYGRSITEEAVNGYSHNDYLELERRFDRALSEGQGASPNTPMGQTYLRLVNGMKYAAEELETRTQAQINNLCSYSEPERNGNPPGLTNSQKFSRNLQALAFSYPAVIRQALVDMTKPERALAQAALCEAGAMPHLRLPHNCSGVSGGPLPGTRPVSINQMSVIDWPYGTPQRMSIARPTGSSPIEVNLKVNLVLGPELENNCPDQNHDGVLDCLERLTNVWRADVNGFLNCSTGQTPNATLWQSINHSRIVPCPTPIDPGLQRNPGVKFNVTFQTHASDDDVPEPKVTIHRCFNSDIAGDNDDKGNCNKVEQINMKNCLTSWTIEVPRTVENCRAEIARRRLSNPAELNRANSRNYSVTDSPLTVRHEVLHALGLPDEYQDEKRPYGHIGEHDSIMRNAGHAQGRIYPRHLDRILSPLRCFEEE
ncbi:MAG: hypothetical protein HYV97_06480 [Bdellovibrio sp.]|nr:hypothetical protein [Bdellovibrio sp.]